MRFNEFLDYYGIQKNYSDNSFGAMCELSADTDIPIKEFTKEGETANE